MFEDKEENFDYASYQEADDDLDFKNLKDCPHCHKPIPVNAISCLYCGRSLSFSTRPPWVIWVALFIIICFVLVVLFWI